MMRAVRCPYLSLCSIRWHESEGSGLWEQTRSGPNTSPEGSNAKETSLRVMKHWEETFRLTESKSSHGYTTQWLQTALLTGYICRPTGSFSYIRSGGWRYGRDLLSQYINISTWFRLWDTYSVYISNNSHCGLFSMSWVVICLVFLYQNFHAEKFCVPLNCHK